MSEAVAAAEITPDNVCAADGAVIDTVGGVASTGGSMRIEVDFDDPFSDAVILTFWLVAIVPAVAVKLPDVAPLTIGSDPGTDSRVAADEANVTDTPPVGAAADRSTLHVDVPPFDKDAALQLTELTVTAGGGAATVTVPEEPVNAMGDPVAEAPSAETIDIVAVADAVIVTFATTPFGIAVAFMPVTMHVATPVAVLAH